MSAVRTLGRISRGGWAVLVAAVLLAGLPAGGGAHPHIWVTYAVVLPVGPHGLEAIEFVWTFDELSSGMILSAVAADAPAADHLRALRAIPYVIEVSYNGVAVELGAPDRLTASVTDRQVTYRFSIPLHPPVTAPGLVDIHLDDPGVFTAFTLRSPAPTEMYGHGPLSADCERARLPSGAPGPVRCVLRAAP